MKGKSIVLYVSLGANVLLLVLAVWPRNDANLAFAQAAAIVRDYAAVSAKGGGNQDALWIANRASGQLAVFQYQLGEEKLPMQLVGTRDLREDLELRQLGYIMLISADISSSNAAVLAIDTDAHRMVVYEYDRASRTIKGIQKINLADAFTKPAPAEGAMEKGRY